MFTTKELLINHGLISDTINVEDTVLKYTKVYPLVLSDKAKHILKILSEPQMKQYGNTYLRSIRDKVYDTANGREGGINRDRITKAMANILGNDIAEQWYNLMFLVYHKHNSPTTDKIKYLTRIAEENYVATLADINNIMMILLSNMYSLKEVDTWYGGGIVNDIMYCDDDWRITTPEIYIDKTKYDLPMGMLIDLPLEDKQNIMGSFWNAFIDIITRVYVNHTEDEKGGE